MWNPFKRKTEQFAKVDITPTQTRQLMNEQAIYQVWDELALETDAILEKLGKSRRDLMAIEYDDEVSAALETRVDALVSTPWKLQGDEAIIEFVRDQLKPCIVDTITAMFNARLYGYSVIETVYKRENGRILLDKVDEKPFYWFQPKCTGELLYHGQNGVGVPVDQNKFILTRCKSTYDNPMGIALLSRLYWPVHYRKYGWQFWLKWLERYGFPSRVGKTPPGLLPDGTSRADDLSDTLQAMAQNSTVVISDDQEVDLLEPGGKGDHFQTIDNAVNKRIQKTILGQTLTSDVGDKGSFAAAKVHDGVRDNKRKSDIRLITGPMQHLVNVIVALNFPNQKVMFIMEDERGLEVERAERDKLLIDAGAIELTEEYLLDRYDFNEGDFVIPEKGEFIPGQMESFSNGFQFARGKTQFTADQQDIEELADDVLKNLTSPVPVELIYSAIRAAKDPDDLEDRLAAIMTGNTNEEFNRVLSRALFSADVMGYANA